MRSGLSRGDLWLPYFELGGMSTALQLEGFLCGALRPTRNDALNERFVELGGNHPVVNSEDQSGTPEKDDL